PRCAFTNPLHNRERPLRLFSLPLAVPAPARNQLPDRFRLALDANRRADRARWNSAGGRLSEGRQRAGWGGEILVAPHVLLVQRRRCVVAPPVRPWRRAFAAAHRRRRAGSRPGFSLGHLSVALNGLPRLPRIPVGHPAAGV